MLLESLLLMNNPEFTAFLASSGITDETRVHILASYKLGEYPLVESDILANYIRSFCIRKENEGFLTSLDTNTISEDYSLVHLKWWRVNPEATGEAAFLLKREQVDDLISEDALRHSAFSSDANFTLISEEDLLAGLSYSINNNFLLDLLTRAGMFPENLRIAENDFIINENSETDNIDETTSRFGSAVWFEDMKSLEITIAGLGGIGSYVAFFVSRLKPTQICGYDMDQIEMANMSGQLYNKDQVGMSKSAAIRQTVMKYSDYYQFWSYDRFDSYSHCSPILICGFDNMESRKIAFSRWLERVRQMSENNKKQALFIDGRLAAEKFQIFCITGDDSNAIAKYKKEWLFTDAEAEQTQCSYKQTSFAAGLIGGLITNLLVNFVTNLKNPMMRNLPFKTEYDCSLLYLTTNS